MPKISRRTVLQAAVAASACGGADDMSKVLPPSARSRGLPPYSQDPRYHQQPVSPVHMSGSIVLQPGASGSIGTSSLMNPMGLDMEILEIKFEISGPAGASVYGASVDAELLLGTNKLTDGSIPIWCFGRIENGRAESAATEQSNGYRYAFYSWRLPRPLFVPAGTTITPNLTHTGLVPSALNVRVSYSGRSVLKKPKIVHVPWVVSYTSKVFNPLSAADTDRSSDLDLTNPHDEPVFIQRIVGRTLTSVFSGNYIDNSDDFAQSGLGIRFTDSFGRPLVRTYVPFRSIFDSTRSWEMDNGAVFDSQGFYIVELKHTAQAGNTGLGQAFISVVGWRDLENP